MPNKPPRNKQDGRKSGRPYSTADLLQRITRHSGRQSEELQSITEQPSLRDRLLAALPAELKPHFLELREKPSELIVFTDAAVWATRIRLALVGQALVGPARLVIKVMPRGGFRR
jgi:hypothetical protein